MTKSITRRIIAILVSTCGVGTCTFLAIMGYSGEALASLITMTSLVLGFYFGTKAAAN